MARLSDDAFATLSEQMAHDRARALGQVRVTSGRHRNAEIAAWMKAGDNLAEKAIAALDLGDETRAARLVDRLIALPVADGVTRSGLMAVSVILHNEVNRADRLRAPRRGRAADPRRRAARASARRTIRRRTGGGATGRGARCPAPRSPAADRGGVRSIS